MTTIETLLEYLSPYGGQIISTKDLQPLWIEQAKASGRMYVNNESLGFVWEPSFVNDIPCTEKEVEMFDKWYPLEVPLPDALKNPEFLFVKRINPRHN